MKWDKTLITFQMGQSLSFGESFFSWKGDEFVGKL